MATIEPTVWPPVESIEGLVCILITPAIKQGLRIAVRNQVIIFVWHEHQVRRGTNPHTTMPDFQTTD